MASNPDFLKVVIKDTGKGIDLLWPRLDQPYRYNNALKRTEPCAANVTGAGYSVSWVMPLADAKLLREKLVTHYNDCRTRLPKLPEFSRIFGSKRDDEKGVVVFTARRKAIKNDGTLNDPPRVVDGYNRDLVNKAIWSGSKGGVRVFAFPSIDPDGVGGISLILDAVVVKEAAYGSDGLADDFDFDDPEDTASAPLAAPSLSQRAAAPAPVAPPPPAPAAAVPADVAF